MNINKVNHLLETSVEDLDLACEFVEQLIKNKRFDVDLTKHDGFLTLLESIQHKLDEKIPSVIENS